MEFTQTFSEYMGDALDDGITQSAFASGYTNWLTSIVLAEWKGGIHADLGVDINQNSEDPPFLINTTGMAEDEFAALNAEFQALFGSSNDINVNTGKSGTKERFYSDLKTDASTNSDPTDIRIVADPGLDSQSGNNVPENTVIGTLTATDPDGDTEFTFTITGGDAAGDFKIEDGKLVTTTELGPDYGTKTLVITVEDGNGGIYPETFTVMVGGGTTVTGTGGDDIIFALNGNDTVNGGAGDDIIVGGNGNDDLSGGTGDDFVFGNNGIDDISGGDGNDVLYGGQGADVLNGGDGDDIIYGGSQTDTANGGPGTDRLVDGDDGGTYSGFELFGL